MNPESWTQLKGSNEKGIELQAEMLAAQFFYKFLHFDLVGKNYFTIFAVGKGI